MSNAVDDCLTDILEDEILKMNKPTIAPFSTMKLIDCFTFLFMTLSQFRSFSSMQISFISVICICLRLNSMTQSSIALFILNRYFSENLSLFFFKTRAGSFLSLVENKKICFAGKVER